MKDEKRTKTAKAGKTKTGQKQAGKALQYSAEKCETYLYQLIQNAPIAMAVDSGVAPDAKGIMLNRRFTELFGYTAEDVPDVRQWWPLAYPDEKYREEVREEWVRRTEKAVRTRSAIEPMETRVTCKDGSIRYIRFYMSSIGERNLVTFEDLSVCKKATEDIDRIFNLSIDLICIADIKQNRFMKVNPSFSRILGYDEKEILSSPFTSFVHPDDISETLNTIKGELTHGVQTLNFINRYRHKNGKYIWLEWTTQPIPQEGITYAIARDVTDRIKVEETLRKREQQLAESQRIAHIGSWQHNLKTNEVVWSDELFRLLGLDPGKDPGDFDVFFSRVHPDDQQALKQVIDETLKTGKHFSIDYRYNPGDGTTRFLHAQAELIADEYGERVILSGTGQDITERKLAEQAVSESEDKFHTLFETANDGVFIIDLEGKFVDVNKTAYRRLGYTKEEMLSMHISQLDTPEFAAMVPQRVEKIMKEGNGVFESAHIRKDGSVMPVEINTRIIELNGKKVFLSIIRDITERKKAEEKLLESEEKLRDITSHLSEGIYVMDERGGIIFMNPEAERLLGWKTEEFTDKNVHDIIHNRKTDGSSLAFKDCPMHNVIKTGIPFVSTEEVFIRKDGSIFPISVISSPINDGRRIVSTVTSFRDITERKKIEADRERLISELKEALARVKQLSGMLPICASCKKIRDDKGYWSQIEAYITEHSEVLFSHGICPECEKKAYQELDELKKKSKEIRSQESE